MTKIIVTVCLGNGCFKDGNEALAVSCCQSINGGDKSAKRWNQTAINGKYIQSTYTEIHIKCLNSKSSQAGQQSPKIPIYLLHDPAWTAECEHGVNTDARQLYCIGIEPEHSQLDTSWVESPIAKRCIIDKLQSLVQTDEGWFLTVCLHLENWLLLFANF